MFCLVIDDCLGGLECLVCFDGWLGVAFVLVLMFIWRLGLFVCLLCVCFEVCVCLFAWFAC